MCAVLRWVHISTCFWEEWISCSQSQRPKGPSRLSLATKANVSGMEVQQSKQHGWLEYVRRYHWHGGIYWDCTETYCHQDDVFHGKSMVIISRQCQVSFCMCDCTTAWFCRQSECARLASRSVSYIENVWLILKRRIRQQQSQTAENLKSCIKPDWTKILLAEL